MDAKTIASFGETTRQIQSNNMQLPHPEQTQPIVKTHDSLLIIHTANKAGDRRDILYFLVWRLLYLHCLSIACVQYYRLDGRPSCFM